MHLNKGNKFTVAGVIALYERVSNSLILTKRSQELRSHPGEVCFPGGIWEEGDKDLSVTALRELNEELGIESNRVRLLKELSQERTLLGSTIYPWLGEIDRLEPLRINSYEVAEVISIPIPLVQDPRNYNDISMQRGGVQFTTCQFIAHEEFIWGATVRIMKQLISIPIGL